MGKDKRHFQASVGATDQAANGAKAISADARAARLQQGPVEPPLPTLTLSLVLDQVKLSETLTQP